MALHLATTPEANTMLADDPLALLLGMLLDQQFPMERAFSGPHLLAQRLGVERLDAAELAAMDADALTDVFRGPPAIHRYPGAMAGRTQAVCRLLLERYGGAADAVWTTAATGAEVVARVAELPGFGSQKARIFTALLGKQFGVQPAGWREAAEPYGVEGTAYSIADVTSDQTLAAVREHKQRVKAEAKAGAETKAAADGGAGPKAGAKAKAKGGAKAKAKGGAKANA